MNICVSNMAAWGALYGAETHIGDVQNELLFAHTFNPNATTREPEILECYWVGCTWNLCLCRCLDEWAGCKYYSQCFIH